VEDVDEEDMEETYAREEERGTGVWRSPMALTLLRRFLRAAKAEDWGSSMRRP
jgi:hypothetical protein